MAVCQIHNKEMRLVCNEDVCGACFEESLLTPPDKWAPKGFLLYTRRADGHGKGLLEVNEEQWLAATDEERAV